MKRAAALSLLALLALAACKGAPDDHAEAVATDVPKAVSGQASSPSGVVESEYGTPVKDRTATLGLLNKRNNLEQDIVLKPGEARRIGNVVVKLASCERTLPWESPPETAAFVQVFVEERAQASDALAWRKVFSGWLFKNSPSLNVVEHPVYDVWVKNCAMKFPGEEEDAAAASTSAPKPSGSAVPLPVKTDAVKTDPGKTGPDKAATPATSAPATPD